MIYICVALPSPLLPLLGSIKLWHLQLINRKYILFFYEMKHFIVLIQVCTIISPPNSVATGMDKLLM